MNKKSAEEILCNEIEIITPGTLVNVIGDLKELIHLGLLKQIDGNVGIGSIPDTPPFQQDVISMFFESVPGGVRAKLQLQYPEFLRSSWAVPSVSWGRVSDRTDERKS